MRYYVGEVVTRFWYGEKIQFKYLGQGEFKCLYKGLVPDCIRKELLNE